MNNQERRIGRWETSYTYFDVIQCSACGSKALKNEQKEYVLSNFCPFCGADMWAEKKKEEE